MNVQMGGMLLGGILWGVYGDKKGRKSVLFGSILLYSIANALNGFVTDLNTYWVLRFIAGIGLAGELGAGITLVNETLPASKRGIGTLIIAGVGAAGAVFAPIVAGLNPDPEWWRTCYFIGGGRGLALLTQLIGIQGSVSGGDAIMYCYIGLSVGDFVSGALSQWFKSRNKVVLMYLLLAWALTLYFLYVATDISQVFANALITALGFFGGYWAVFLTASSEQFGTNIRMTVTTTVPNFVRGALIPISLLFKFLIPSLGLINAAAWVGVLCFSLAIFAISQLKDTFGKSLDFVE
jgi:MFS family permease